MSSDGSVTPSERRFLVGGSDGSDFDGLGARINESASARVEKDLNLGLL